MTRLEFFVWEPTYCRPASQASRAAARGQGRGDVRCSPSPLWAAMAFVLVGTFTANPGAISAQQAESIPLEEILQLLEVGLPEARIFALIAEVCVLQADPQTSERQLAAAGASLELRRMVAAFDCYRCPTEHGELLVTFEQAGAELTVLSGEASAVQRSGPEVRICGPQGEPLLIRVEVDAHDPLSHEMLLSTGRRIEARVDLGPRRPVAPQRSIPPRPSDPAPRVAALQARLDAMEHHRIYERRQNRWAGFGLIATAATVAALYIAGDEGQTGPVLASGAVGFTLGLWRADAYRNQARVARESACGGERNTTQCFGELEDRASSLQTAAEAYATELRDWEVQAAAIVSERQTWENRMEKWREDLSTRQRWLVLREVAR